MYDGTSADDLRSVEHVDRAAGSREAAGELVKVGSRM